MKKSLVCGMAGLAILQYPALVAHAQPMCPSDLSSLRGGQVYFYDDKGNFTPLSSASPLEASDRTSVALFYIINASGFDRSGAIVIKSARYGQARNDDVPEGGRVRLERRERGGRCDPQKSTFSGSVSTQAYHEYHDLGQDKGDYLSANGRTALNTLKAFHISYETQRGDNNDNKTGCRQTDSKLTPNGDYEARSNRSQFSFDTNIVDFGFSTAAYNISRNFVVSVREFVVTPAQAAPEQLRERYVEIKSYRTTSGMACLPFTLDLRAPAQMLRVNDIEGRDLTGTRRQEFRVGYGVPH